VTVQAPDVSVDLSGPERVRPGQPVEWTIIVRNHGPGTATNVGVQDVLPPGVTNLQLDPDVSGCSVDTTTNALDCAIPSIPEGGAVVIHLIGTPSTANEPLLVNTVTVTSANDPDTSNNSARLATRVADSSSQPGNGDLGGHRGSGGGGGGDDCRHRYRHDHGRGDWTDFTDGHGNRC
jgi:uncharacterized repeat protein (TIGR01451 family)